MSKKTILIIASFSGALAIIFGAMGAHALESELSAKQLASFKTGSLYHILHSIVLLVLGFSSKVMEKKSLTIVTWLFIIGIVLFSGSIYLLATKELIGFESLSLLGPVTPLGGLLLIAGWISIGVLRFKQKDGE
jgi:uncharacterized membrane protein YgdD (TMEM256/DUF423 family)